MFGNTIVFKFKRSLLVSDPEVKIFLSLLRSNLEQEIGCLEPKISHFEKDKSRIYRVMKGKLPVGTI